MIYELLIYNQSSGQAKAIRGDDHSHVRFFGTFGDIEMAQSLVLLGGIIRGYIGLHNSLIYN